MCIARAGKGLQNVAGPFGMPFTGQSHGKSILQRERRLSHPSERVHRSLCALLHCCCTRCLCCVCVRVRVCVFRFTVAVYFLFNHFSFLRPQTTSNVQVCFVCLWFVFGLCSAPAGKQRPHYEHKKTNKIKNRQRTDNRTLDKRTSTVFVWPAVGAVWSAYIHNLYRFQPLIAFTVKHFLILYEKKIDIQGYLLQGISGYLKQPGFE